jgi:hypothetical protein
MCRRGRECRRDLNVDVDIDLRLGLDLDLLCRSARQTAIEFSSSSFLCTRLALLREGVTVPNLWYGKLQLSPLLSFRTSPFTLRLRVYMTCICVRFCLF